MPGPSACIKEAEGTGTGTTWMRETGKRGHTGRRCLEVITVYQDYQGYHLRRARQERTHSGFPMPLAPAWRAQAWKTTRGGRDKENGCPGVVSILASYQTPSLSHTPFYHLKNGANRGRNKLTF